MAQLSFLISTRYSLTKFARKDRLIAIFSVILLLCSQEFAVSQSQNQDQPKATKPRAPEPSEKIATKPPITAKDIYGDPLPTGAIARLGSISGTPKGEKPRGHQATVHLVTFSPDGKFIASRDADQIVRVWDVATSKVTFETKVHVERVKSITFSPDSKRLATAAWNETVRMWDLSSGKEIFEITGGGNLIQFVDEGKHLIIVRENECSIVNSSDGKKVSSTKLVRLSPLSITHDSKLVAGKKKLADLVIHVYNTKDATHQYKFEGCKTYPQTATFSQNDSLLAAGGRDGVVYLWDVKSQKLLHKMQGHEQNVQQITFSPNQQLLVSGSWDDTFRLWETNTGREIKKISAHKGNVCAVAFSPNGQLLATGSADNTILLWDVGALIIPIIKIPITDEMLTAMWTNFGSENGTAGYHAIGTFVADAKKTIPFAEKKLEKVLVKSQEKEILAIIKQLGHTSFRIRELATKELIKRRGAADALLRKTLSETTDSEVKSRIIRVLKVKVEPIKISAEEQRRMIRLFSALQRLASAESKTLLTKIFQGYPAPQIQTAAMEALKRISPQKPKAPEPPISSNEKSG